MFQETLLSNIETVFRAGFCVDVCRFGCGVVKTNQNYFECIQDQRITHKKKVLCVCIANECDFIIV